MSDTSSGNGASRGARAAGEHEHHDTTASLAASDAKLLAAMRPVCQAACEECEKACRVHEDHHRACRECAEACAAVVAALKKAA